MATVTFPNHQPSDINNLSPVGYKFYIESLPQTNWFLTSVNLPSISLAEVPHPTPLMQAAVAGNDLVFDPLNITFLVDENLNNWRELYDWLRGLGFPHDYKEYNKDHLYSDATLTILNSNMNPNYNIVFKDLFPTSLGEILFDSASADIEGIKATATFRYLTYTYENI